MGSNAKRGHWQQRYFEWAARFYDRLPAEAAAEARKLDELLLQRRGLMWGALGGTAAGVAGSVLGLVGTGFPWALALLVSVLLAWGVLVAGLSAWLQPERVLGGWGWRVVTRLTAVAFAGAMLGFLVGRIQRKGWPAPEAWPGLLLAAARWALPVLAVAMLALLVLMLAVAWARRQVMQRELHELRLVNERDAAARQAAEAQLKLLQGQIQPHFIFNTLSAVQHWVDSGDPRGAALLRDLTAFLRGSTELLGRERVPLAEEVAMVGHYLAIMQGRLGERLRSRIDIAPELAALPLPPGLLLTLVENAVEHGIAPALQGGQIMVTARRDGASWTLAVCDSEGGSTLADPLQAVPDTARTAPAPWQDGVGLTNTRQRLAHAFGERAALALETRPGGSVASITVTDPA